MHLDLLFPSPVAIIDDCGQFQKEKTVLLNLEYVYDATAEYDRSKDTHVLETVPKLKEWLKEQLDSYARIAFGIEDDLSITQSWCIKHKAGVQSIFKHIHRNSIISAAYYVKSENSQGLTFYRNSERNKYITWKTDNNNISDKPWTWQFQHMPSKTGMLIIFPSDLEHAVIKSASPSDRCVLSFNTWFNNPIGEEEKLTRTI